MRFAVKAPIAAYGVIMYVKGNGGAGTAGDSRVFLDKHRAAQPRADRWRGRPRELQGSLFGHSRSSRGASRNRLGDGRKHLGESLSLIVTRETLNLAHDG